MEGSVLDDPTMRSVVQRMEALWPDAPALVDRGECWTYARLADDCRRAARALLARGICRGDRIAIWAPNCAQWVIAAMAAQLVGATIVPLNTRYKAAEAAFILRRSRARLVLTVRGFLGGDYPAILSGAALPDLSDTIVLADLAEETQDWQRFLAAGDAIDDARFEAAIGAVTADDPSDILFTSGTTGEPKGVISRQGPTMLLAQRWGEPVGLGPGDQYLIINPFFHSFGYKAGWLACLVAGATIHAMATFDAAAALDYVERQRISVLPGPPALFQSMLADPTLRERDLTSLRVAVTGAAAIPPILIERMAAQLGFERVLTAYGLTEAPIVTMSPAGDSAEMIATTCGVAIAGVELRIADDAGKPLPEGEPGEVLVRGFNVMDAYLDDPAATSEAIDAQAWLHTGDIGTLVDGRLRITDRKKEMYICGGFNCYPAEIERMMAAHPEIMHVAVIGVPDDRHGEVGRAYVVLRPDAKATDTTIVAWCREAMANYKVPRSVVMVDALPMTPSGKVRRHDLHTLG